MKRRPRELIDTGWKQSRNVGFLSLAKPASYIPDIVSGVAQFCFERSAVLDGILITGDLATTGMMSDIGVANCFINEPATRGFVTENRFPTLNASNAPMYLLPGNHDKFTNTRGSPNGKNFELKFGGHMRNFASGVGHWVQRKKEHFVGFVFADFCLLARGDALDKGMGPYGQGRVYQHVLDELRNRTFVLRNRYEGIYLVWVIHFASIAAIDFSSLIEVTLCNPLFLLAL